MYLEFISTPTRSALAWRGLANLLMGIILLVWPQATVYVVILFFSLNLILVGLFTILEPLFARDNPHAIVTVALGVLGVVFGVYLIIKPEFAAAIVGILIAFWAILFGLFDFMISYKMHQVKAHFGWAYTLIGIISVVFGIYMLLSPVEGVLSIVWVFGMYAAVVGVILLLTSLLMSMPNSSPKPKKVKKVRSKK